MFQICTYVYEKIDRSIQQVKEGKVLRVSTNDDLKNCLI